MKITFDIDGQISKNQWIVQILPTIIFSKNHSTTSVDLNIGWLFWYLTIRISK